MAIAQRRVPWTREALAQRLLHHEVEVSRAADGALPSERVLAQRFAVSRPFLREVLRGLEQRGVIDIVPARGAFVRDVGPLDAARATHDAYRHQGATPRHLVEARATLERQTATLAAERATDDDLAAIERARRSFDSADGLLARASADIAFHTLIARAAHNPVLETIFGAISTLVFETMIRSLGDTAVVRTGAPMHATIIEALLARDGERAADAMGRHINLANSTYGADLDQDLEELVRTILAPAGGAAKVEDLVRAALENHTSPREELRP